jgi:S1-C subfamily serine protease
LASGLLIAVVSVLVLVATMTAAKVRAAADGVGTEVLGEVVERGAPPARATVRVTVLGCGGYSVGSGVLLDGGRVLTAGHVVTGATTITVELASGTAARSTVIATDANGRDAALLRVPAFADEPGVAIARNEPEPGDAVEVLGHPRGGALRAQPAAVVAFTTSAPLSIDGGRVMTVDVPFDAGVSGGPVVDGADALVALAVGVERVSGVGIALPIDALDALLAGDGVTAPRTCDPTR